MEILAEWSGCTRVGTRERTDLADRKIGSYPLTQCPGESWNLFFQYFRQLSKNSCSSLKIEDTKEQYKAFLVHRVREGGYDIRMLLKGNPSLAGNPHTKIFNLRLGKLAHIAGLMLRQWRWRQNLADMAEVRFCIRTGNENVIYIHKTVRNITKTLVHHPLKCANEPPKAAKRSYHCCLGNVFFGHRHLIAALEARCKISNVGERVLLLLLLNRTSGVFLIPVRSHAHHYFPSRYHAWGGLFVNRLGHVLLLNPGC